MNVQEIRENRKQRWAEYETLKNHYLECLKNARVTTGQSDPARHPRDTFDAFVNGEYVFTGCGGLQRSAAELRRQAINSRASQMASATMTSRYWRGWQQ